MLEYILQQKQATWGQQFKNAIMLGPTIDEDNSLEDISYQDAILHVLSISWKLFFAIIPPSRILHGWPSFFVALFFIGCVTAVIGEFASLLGCAIGLKDSVTAITLVALGTSLPDTLASKTAAINSEYADSAVGNITGSNSVNVFLGLGLPWTIATIYYKVKEDSDYIVPQGALGFSVILFISVAVCCFIILVLRRIVSKSFSMHN